MINFDPVSCKHLDSTQNVHNNNNNNSNNALHLYSESYVTTISPLLLSKKRAIFIS